MKALEDRASEMLQGASLSGGTQASISEMLGNEMDRVQQALEHRFSRIETDIETLIQQVRIVTSTSFDMLHVGFPAYLRPLINVCS